MLTHGENGNGRGQTSVSQGGHDGLQIT